MPAACAGDIGSNPIRESNYFLQKSIEGEHGMKSMQADWDA